MSNYYKNNKCKYCKKNITNYANKCKKCHLKELNLNRKQRTGEKAPAYKDGRSLKKYYCKENCGREISYCNWKYGNKRCKPCNTKYNHKMGVLNIKGKNNGRYVDGRASIRYPQEYTYYLRQKIKKRDNYTCQLCKIKEKKFKLTHYKGLEIHHIDYNKKNCKENNLITLCGNCNKRVNFNRDWWFAYFNYLPSIAGLLK